MSDPAFAHYPEPRPRGSVVRLGPWRRWIGAGWRAGCRCGWAGPARLTRAGALAAAADRHRLDAPACADCGRPRPWDSLEPVLRSRRAPREVLICAPQDADCRALALRLDQEEQERARRAVAARLRGLTHDEIDARFLLDRKEDHPDFVVYDVISSDGAWRLRAPHPAD
jgi:hypothetical protein